LQGSSSGRRSCSQARSPGCCSSRACQYFRNVLSALDVVESETFVQLVRALQDPLAEVHQRVPTLPPAEQAVAARIASLRALSATP